MIPFSLRNNNVQKYTPTKWLIPNKWPTSHFREWPFIRGSSVFCTKLTESEYVLVPSSEYMTDLRSLNQYITDQEQEEHRLQRGIWSQTCCTINVILIDQGGFSGRIGSALNSNSSGLSMKFAFKPNSPSGWHLISFFSIIWSDWLYLYSPLPP